MAESNNGSKKLLWIMVFLVLLSSAGAAAALYMVMGRETDSATSEAQQVTQRQAPIFLRIEPFTVNLADDTYGSRLLYVGVTLRVGEQQNKELLEEHMPQVRSRLLTLFSGKQANDLTSAEGKQQLANEVIGRLSVPMAENQPLLDLREVLFTEFIVQ
ncbi:flagellar basal body-associated protein FliL [Halomonas sediminis]